jgi:hypothetical protein
MHIIEGKNDETNSFKNFHKTRLCMIGTIFCLRICHTFCEDKDIYSTQISGFNILTPVIRVYILSHNRVCLITARITRLDEV